MFSLPMAKDDRIWHLSSAEGESLGPYTSAEMAQYVRTGRIQASTSIWREGWSNWQLAADVPDFGGLVLDARHSPQRNTDGRSADGTPGGHTSRRSTPPLQWLASLPDSVLRSIRRLSQRSGRR